jgi:hypothetical protein
VANAPRQPAAPISKAMREGKEPLRTFGDLKQFFASKPGDETPEAVPESTAAPEQPEPSASPSAAEQGRKSQAHDHPAEAPEGQHRNQHDDQTGRKAAEEPGSPPQSEADGAG